MWALASLGGGQRAPTLRLRRLTRTDARWTVQQNGLVIDLGVSSLRMGHANFSLPRSNFNGLVLDSTETDTSPYTTVCRYFSAERVIRRGFICASTLI